jgi:hypothetical protein
MPKSIIELSIFEDLHCLFIVKLIKKLDIMKAIIKKAIATIILVFFLR